MPPYEVWCHACNVTFPPEQKRCLHCGARTRPDAPARGRRPQVRELTSAEQFAAYDETGPMTVIPQYAHPPEAMEADEEPVRRSLLRAGMTVLWMVLLAAGYAWRACSQ